MADQKINAKRLLLVCAILMIFSCGSRTDFAGHYQAEASKDGIVSDLEIEENGEGYWRVGESEEMFSWYPKGDEIRFNTRNGGVIVAKIHGNRLEIILPGGKELSFKRLSDIGLKNSRRK